jgi:hypothetical protein
MALTTITAKTGAKLDGRLLARNGAVNLDTNTITTSACASTPAGSGGTGTLGIGGTIGGGTPVTAPTTGTATPGTGGTTGTPIGSRNTTSRKQRAAQKRARLAKQRKARLAKERKLRLARARAQAHRSPAKPPTSGRSFTG